jgi:hypothetical protein
MKAAIHCDVCGEVILEGKRLYYDNGVEEKDDGIDGEYREDCGRCEICGHNLCGPCGDFKDGVCADCREAEDGEDCGASIVNSG